MKFEKKIGPYLEGTSFSNGLIVQIAEGMESAHDRLQIIENLVAGRSVIHVGCVDHIPLLNDKIKKINGYMQGCVKKPNDAWELI